MLQTLAEALQATGWARSLAASVWVYPLVNTAHIVGIALLLGSIVPLDLRLAGCWPRVPVEPLMRVLLPTACAGLVLALCSGALLFAARAPDYVAEPLFALKLGLLLAALANAWWFGRSERWRVAGPQEASPPRAWRVAGVLSIVLWLAVVTVGRLIGYR